MQPPHHRYHSHSYCLTRRAVHCCVFLGVQCNTAGPADTHAHAPQFFFGVGTDLPLFEWLQQYTFPSEASFADTAHARRTYTAVVRRLLRLGTTTANYFTTLHVDACKVRWQALVRLADCTVAWMPCAISVL